MTAQPIVPLLDTVVPSPATVRVRSTDTVDWLSVHGRLDRSAMAAVWQAFDRSAGRTAAVIVINLRAASSVDPLALISGVAEYRMARRELADLVFTGARPALARQLRFAGLTVTCPR